MNQVSKTHIYLYGNPSVAEKTTSADTNALILCVFFNRLCVYGVGVKSQAIVRVFYCTNIANDRDYVFW